MNDELIEAYMRAYLYELEKEINANQNILKDVRFQMDEANTDKEVKQVLKDYINNSCNTIKKIKKVIIDNKEYDLDIHAFSVFARIPDDYTEDDKELVKEEKSAVYVNPDMILKCKIHDIETKQYLELKSTKDDKIPGSSVQQVVPDEWVLFIKHSKGKIESVSGQYKNSISGTMQFPDRSPRPQVSYNELKQWLQEYRVETESTLEFRHDKNNEGKEKLLTDWQGVLSDRWLNVLKSDKKKKNEPWFNNNLRKFVISLLEYYDSMSSNEKESFKGKIKNNIDEGE